MMLGKEWQPKKTISNLRLRDPLMDRRCGDDRRKVHFLPYFDQGNQDRRSDQERRYNMERRANCVRVSEWSSVCLEQESELWP